MSLLDKLGVLSLSLVCLGGCKDLAEPVSSTSRAIVLRNGLALNGLALNGLALNGLAINGLAINGLAINGLALNGLAINGLAINGLAINGLAINGLAINGLAINGLAINGKVFNKLALEGSVLVATNGSQTLKGTQLKGSVLNYEFRMADGSKIPFQLKIEDVKLEPGSKDVWTYYVTQRFTSDPANVPWASICSNEQGKPDYGIPLAGVWDQNTGNRIDAPNVFTFACRDFALGKCVTLGYRPWAKAIDCTSSYRSRDCDEVALSDYHQACTRMIRADYCGNGKSFTVNGTVIDVYDYLDPPINVPETDWDIESRWTTKGALCLSEPRHPELLLKWKWPDCDNDGKPDKAEMFKSCNEGQFRNKGMIVTRVNEYRKDRDRDRD